MALRQRAASSPANTAQAWLTASIRHSAAVRLHGVSHAARQFPQPHDVARGRRDCGVILRAGGQKFRQPHALAAALRAHAVHAVVPVPRAHQRQAVRAGPRRAAKRTHAVFVQRAGGPARPHLPVDVLAVIGDRDILQKGHRFLQHGGVAGGPHIGRRRIGQEQHVVGYPGAHAAEGLMPPVHHVPRFELMRRAAQDVPAHPLRLLRQQRQHVLQLIPEAVGSAGLV